MIEVKTVLSEALIVDMAQGSDMPAIASVDNLSSVIDFARAIEAAVLSANAGKVDALPISSGYALENFAVWIVQELHPMSESRETVERLLHAYMHDTAKPQPSQHNESE